MINIEQVLVEYQTKDEPNQMRELTEAQLALIGGGIGEVIVG